MRPEFINGWRLAANWIYTESVEREMNVGYNPKGYEVTAKMKELPTRNDAGFSEGLIFAIGKPISSLKKALIESGYYDKKKKK